ncbi:MAG: RDD family protein [Bacteroidia bacterium]|nr:RDD family protein [Bacteroidia bacterium]
MEVVMGQNKETGFKFPPLGIRLAAALVDVVSLTILNRAVIFLFGTLITSETDDSNKEWFLAPDLLLFGAMVIFLLSLFLNKDVFNGQSLGKRLFNLQIIKQSTGQIATPIECVFRNVTLIIWPLEVLFILVSPSSRLGDNLVGTKLVYKQAENIDNPNWTKLFLAIIIGLLITAIVCAIGMLLLFVVTA